VVVAFYDHVPEFSKKAALQWFRKKIDEHLFSGAVLHAKVFEADAILDKEVSDVYVPKIESAGFAAILLKPDRARVVLVKSIFFQNISLGCEEFLCPDGIG
jgi:hypothetical protein